MHHRIWRFARLELVLVAGLLPALGSTVAHAEGEGWQWQNPLPQGNTLNGVWGSSGGNVFAVGSLGTILHYGGRYSLYLPLVVKS
jgi:hypothetical protein